VEVDSVGKEEVAALANAICVRITKGDASKRLEHQHQHQSGAV
jgi:hypothetical protein